LILYSKQRSAHLKQTPLAKLREHYTWFPSSFQVRLAENFRNQVQLWHRSCCAVVHGIAELLFSSSAMANWKKFGATPLTENLEKRF
jgi:hypothetical protein